MDKVDTKALRDTVEKIMTPAKGILAADASNTTINKRFAMVGVAGDEETRRRYRELLFTTPNISEGISAVILYDETIRQSTADGRSFIKVLEDSDIVPGIKVDKGKVPLPFFNGEEITEGLDGLRDRLSEYRNMGARFAKWRAVIQIGDGMPTSEAIDANMHALVRYAGICQMEKIVPIVEPEVLMNGDHSIEMHEEVTRRTYTSLFKELEKYRIPLPCLILKTAMVLPGKESPRRADAHEIAEHTLRALNDHVPEEIGGVVFLSGGQGPVESTENFNEIMKGTPHPFPMTFSFARALQDPVLKEWIGEDSNKKKAQEFFLHRIRMDVSAQKGEWTKEMES